MPNDRVSVTEATRPFYAGVDLGGTNIKSALVDDAGRVLAVRSEPTHAARGPEDAAARMAASVAALAADVGLSAAEVARVGLGSPGPLDIPAGTIVRAGNLRGWDGFPLRDRVSGLCGRPVTFANDANAAAYGEFWVGSARGLGSLVMLTLGTGVGGGIIVGDVNIAGEHSHGSECGHILVDPSPGARGCPCGQPGHLEAYASATSLVAMARERLAAGATGPLAAAVADGEPLTAVLIGRTAAGGDEVARDVILEAARWLGLGVVSLMHAVDPAVVVIGGAMTFGGESEPAGKLFIERIRAEIRARAFPLLAERTPIRYAALGGAAGSIGAAGLARLDHRAGG